MFVPDAYVKNGYLWPILSKTVTNIVTNVTDSINHQYRGDHWRLREFFGRKSTFFSSYISKDSPFSCDHFDGKVVVKGWPEAEKSWKKTPKISINYNSIVTSSMTSSLWISLVMNQPGNEVYWIRSRGGILAPLENFPYHSSPMPSCGQ